MASDLSFSKRKSHFVDVWGVRITPGQLALKNAYEGKIFLEKITIMNISSRPVVLRTLPPESSGFEIVNALYGFKLSSGLVTTIKVRYHCSYMMKHKQVETSFSLFINDRKYDYLVSIRESSASLYPIPRLINFGIVNIRHSVNVRWVELYNKGYKAAKFELDLALNELDLVVIPKKGFIPARGSKKIRIEFIGFNEGVFLKELWVKCDKPFRLMVAATVIVPKLFVKGGLNTNDFHFMNFAPIYSTCTSKMTCNFLNFNTKDSAFVVIPEIGNDLMSFEDAYEKNKLYSCFTVTPSEGTLEPDEEKTVEFSYTPLERKCRVRTNYFVFFRIVRLPGMDAAGFKLQLRFADWTSDSGSSKSLERENSLLSIDEVEDSHDTELHDIHTFDPASCGSQSIKLCLHTIVEPLKVQIIPDHINLGNMKINTTRVFNIKLINENCNLPIHFMHHKTAFFNVTPRSGILYCDKWRDINVAFTPRSAIRGATCLIFDFYYPNQPYKVEEKMSFVGDLKITVYVKVNLISTDLQPKFNPGITPLYSIGNEVGLRTDKIKFNDKIKKPRQAMLDMDKHFPCKESDAYIAFPNDMVGVLRPNKWKDNDRIIKTIFARLPRYIVSTDEYMLTEKQLQCKNCMLNYYKKYLQESYEARALVNKNNEDILAWPGMEKCVILDTLDNCNKAYDIQYFQAKKHTMTNYNPMQLTPMQMFFIKATPSDIDAGKVSQYSYYEHQVKFYNNNNFTIFIEVYLPPALATLLTIEPQKFDLRRKNSKIVNILFHGKYFGKFQTIIQFIVNNTHTLPISFSANVVGQFMQIDENEYVIDLKSPFLSTNLVMSNTLNVPVQYKWNVSIGNAFAVRPGCGTIEPNRHLISEIYYQLDLSERLSSKLVLTCSDGSKQSITATVLMEKINVVLAQNVIEIPNIPLNLEYRAKAVILNRGYEPVFFTVRNPKPIPGITITPSEELLQARSYKTIYILIVLPIVVSFEIPVYIEIHGAHELCLTLKGEVIFPSFSIKPNKINLKRIIAGSYDYQQVIITNDGKAPLKLDYVQNIQSEFKLSKKFKPTTDCFINNLSLTPGESIKIVLMYFPIDVSMNKMYLPFKINGLLGPPLMEVEDSTFVSTYLDLQEKSYENKLRSEIRYLSFLNYPSTYPTVLVTSIASRTLLEFSTYQLNFQYHGHHHFESITDLEITIKNKSKDLVEFLIRIDDLNSNFEIHVEKLINVTMTEVAVVVNLDPAQVLQIPFKFTPTSTGNFTAILPIYLRGYNEGSVFNFIELNGYYPSVTLSCKNEIVLLPIVVGQNLKEILEVKASYHMTNCTLNVKHNSEDIVVVFPEGNTIQSSALTDNIYVEIIFAPTKPMSFFTKMHISCKCGVSTEVHLMASADSCSITTYTFEFMNIDEQSFGETKLSMQSGTSITISHREKSFYRFPYFVLKEDTSIYAIGMQKVCDCVERWVYKQVMFGKYFISIPEQINDVFINLRTKEELNEKVNKKKRPSKQFEDINNKDEDVLVIVKILMNLLGDDVKGYVWTGNLPPTTQKIERVLHIHNSYKNILKFLGAQGAYVAHVRPKLLLKFHQYQTYENYIRIKLGKTPEKDIEVEESFYLRSKQAWLDLLLQIFRVLVLPRVRSKNMLTGGSTISIQRSRSRLLTKTSSYFGFDNGDPESILKSWLQQQYKTNKATLKNITYDKEVSIPHKKIQNFTSDLTDGLILICMILNCCPYLEPYFRFIYTQVDSFEKAFHNAAKIVHALNVIKISFQICPMDIVQPNTVQMIMFSTYCYEVLPFMFPQSTIKFKASLSTTSTETITLKNLGQSRAYYEIIFLNNELQSFSTNYDFTMDISPKQNKDIKVSYTAKRISPIHVILIFNGEVNGERYSRSIVYVLEGVPDFQKDCQVFSFKQQLYSTETVPILVKSPFKETASYLFKFMYRKPSLEDLEICSCASFVGGMKIKMANIKSDKPITFEYGVAEIDLTLSCFTIYTSEFWIIFLSSIGDFFVKIELSGEPLVHIDREILEIEIPSDWDKTRCYCKNIDKGIVDEKKCERIIELRIPRRNTLMWKNICELFLTEVKETDVQAWKHYLESETGPDILNWILTDECHRSETLEDIENNFIRYSIYAGCGYQLPSKVNIENIKDLGYVSTYIHIPEEALLQNFEMNLVSNDNKEVRMYFVRFMKTTASLSKLLSKGKMYWSFHNKIENYNVDQNENEN